MTTTAHEDQFTVGTQTIEKTVRQPYDTVAILRRNIAALEVAMKQQTERAEAAEAELARLAQQKPVVMLNLSHDGSDFEMFYDLSDLKFNSMRMPLYAAPVPAPHKGATHCDDCGLTWLDDGLNPLGCPYCKVSAPAPAVPAEWREAMQEAHDTFQRYADLHWAKDTRDSHEKAKVNQKLANKLYALLQSAEVRHD